MADYIPDSVTVLQNGTGTPYLGIFNGMAKPIMDPKYNLPIGMYVTSFEYVYDEEDCDEATIHLDCDNPDLVDLNDLQYYRPIQLQWGYIYPSNMTYQGPVRKVMITGREVSFDETGTHITLTMGDATTILKNSPANYYNNTKGLLAYLVDITKEIPIGYTLSDYKETTIKSQVVAKKIIPEEELVSREYYYRSKYGTNTGPTENIPWVFPGTMDTGRVNLLTGEVDKTNPNVFKGYLEEGLPSVIPEGLVAMTLLEANEGNIKFAEQFPEWARLVDIEIGGAYNLAILGVSTNKYNQLGEIFRWAKNGPYFLDGRDNMLNIHNQLTNRPISKVYTYAGGNGELLEFRVSSEFTISVVGVTKTTEIGPDKTVKQTMTQVVNVDDAPGKWDKENTVFGIWPEGFEHNSRDGQRNFWGDIRYDGKGAIINPEDKDSNSMESGKFVQPSNHVEVPEGYYEAVENAEYAKKVEANSPNAVYDSISAAKGSLSLGNLLITQEEAERFWKEFKARFDEEMAKNNKPANDEAWGKYLHEFHNLGTLYLHRKAKIRAVIDVTTYADPENQEVINAVLSGEADLAGNVTKGIKHRTSDSLVGEDVRMNMGIEFLKSNGFTIIQDMKAIRTAMEARGIDITSQSGSGFQGMRYMRVIEYEAEFDVPIDGTRVVANTPIEWASVIFPQMLEEHTQDQMEASAVVIGDPCLESSMNIFIRNVSSRYSGVWYAKKVTHRFSTGEGYKCELEFRQRTTDTITNTANCTVNIREVLEGVQKRTQDILKAGESVGGTNEKWENPDPNAPSKTLSTKVITEARETYGKEVQGDKSVLIDLRNRTLGQGLEGISQENGNLHYSDAADPYGNAYNELGKITLNDPTVILESEEWNENSEGAKNLQNQ